MFRIAFDPALPLAATSAFQDGGATVEAGEVFDWRARGISEIDALALFRSGLLTHPLTPPTPAPVPAESAQDEATAQVPAASATSFTTGGSMDALPSSDDKLVAFKVAPGETLHVQTPPQARNPKRR